MEGDHLVVPYDKDHLREGPTFERDEDFTRSHEERVYGHYGRTGYWDAVRPARTTRAARRRSPRLRSPTRSTAARTQAGRRRRWSV